MQTLKGQKAIRYLSSKQNPADEQQYKYFNYEIENALGSVGNKKLDYK